VADEVVGTFEAVDGGLTFRVRVNRKTLEASFDVSQTWGSASHAGNLKDEITAKDGFYLAVGSTTLYAKDGAAWLKYDWMTGMTQRKNDVRAVVL